MQSDPETTWALVMNRTRARILRGYADLRHLPSELVLKSSAPALRDIMADRPGRSFASAGGGRRSAYAYGADPLAEDERLFLREVIALLESHRRAGDFTALAVFAEPHVLGLLRADLPPALAGLVTHEEARNLIQLEPRDLARTVAARLGLPDA